MIERILDNYYTKKLKRYLDRILMIYYIDHRYIETNENLELQIKKLEYNDEQYKSITTYKKKDIFIHLCNTDDLYAILKSRLDKYAEEVEEDK